MAERKRKTEVLYIRLEEGETERFKLAAEAEGITEVSAWARARLRRIVDQILGGKKKKVSSKEG